MELSEKQKKLLIELVIDATSHLNIIENLCLSDGNSKFKELEKESNTSFLEKVKKLKITKDQMPKVMEYLESYGDYSKPEIVDDLVYEENDSLILKRIVNAIRYNLINYGDYFKLDKEIFESTSLYDNSFNYYFDDINTYMKTRFALENDFYKILINCIEVELKDPYNKDIVKELTRAKYKLLYLNPDFESIYTNDEDLFYLSSRLVGDSLSVDDLVYDDMLESYTYDLIEFSFDELMSFTEERLNGKLSKTSMILRLNVILSALILGGEETFEELLEFYEENDLNTCFLVERLLEDVIDNYKLKKEKYKTLSLRINLG